MIPIKPLNLSDFYDMLSGSKVTLFDSTPFLLKAASGKSQLIQSIPGHGKKSNICSCNKKIISWIEHNPIFASVILLSLAMIISIVVYACSTRYYLNSRCGVVLDRWTGKVMELR